MSQTMLFSPGPVMVEDCVREALMHYDICHRSPEFEGMFRNIQRNVRRLFRADESYYALVVSGSGTSANETALSSLFAPGDAALLVSNGMFGERLEEILDKYGIPKIKPACEWAELPDLNKIEEALAANPAVRVVAMVFHETSTSMINPVREIGRIAKKYGKLLFVDCVSAAAGEHIEAADSLIDVCTGVGGKCLGAFPGAAYICAKEELLANTPASQGRNVYLNLGKHYEMAKKYSQTPNTPNVTLFWALKRALTRVLDEEGLERRIARYRACAKLLREGMRAMGLKTLLADELASNTVTSVFLPEGRDLPRFIADMEADGYTIYPGKGIYLERNMFQVANMGNIHPADCEAFLEALEKRVG